jgi:predicted ArsR family transcriptional regulator
MAAMDDTTIHRALGDRSRVRLLRALRTSDRALDVSELAAAVGLHPNTVRSHLATLEDAHLVTHSPDHSHARGRPRILYSSSRRLHAGDTAAPLLELLDGLGFEPELSGVDDAPELRMFRCPFGITPEAPAPQICRAHVGLIRGAIDELRTPLEIERLEVYPEPAYCSLHLRRAASVETT